MRRAALLRHQPPGAKLVVPHARRHRARHEHTPQVVHEQKVRWSRERAKIVQVGAGDLALVTTINANDVAEWLSLAVADKSWQCNK